MMSYGRPPLRRSGIRYAGPGAQYSVRSACAVRSARPCAVVGPRPCAVASAVRAQSSVLVRAVIAGGGMATVAGAFGRPNGAPGRESGDPACGCFGIRSTTAASAPTSPCSIYLIDCRLARPATCVTTPSATVDRDADRPMSASCRWRRDVDRVVWRRAVSSTSPGIDRARRACRREAGDGPRARSRLGRSGRTRRRPRRRWRPGCRSHRQD